MVLQFDVLIHPNKTEEIEKKDDKYGYNFFGFKDIFSDIKPAVKNNELLLPHKEIFPQIHEILANIFSEKHAIAIPLYYLYTSEIITPQKLKDYDYNLLKGLLKGGKYKIGS